VSTVLALCVEFISLSYPRNLILHAIYRRATRTDCQRRDTWRCLTRIFPLVFSGFS
jgi:hypothetical protein